MNDTDLLSVIVLTYKHGDLLFETIDSILDQTYPYVELIVAEDGAPKFDRIEVERYLSRKNALYQILSDGRNRGTVKNINHALSKVHGQYIKLIAGDDTYPNAEVFSKQVAELKKDETKQFVVGNTVECDEQMHRISETGFAPCDVLHLLETNDSEELLRVFVRKQPSLFATQAICFRHDFFDKYGFFDERFKLIEDLPMGVRIINSDCDFCYINYPCVNHRGSVGISTSNNAFDIKRVAYYIDLKNYYEITLKPINKIVGCTYVYLRGQICSFRIQVAQRGSSKLKKAILCVKYAPALVYYVFTNRNRTRFYLKK